MGNLLDKVFRILEDEKSRNLSKAEARRIKIEDNIKMFKEYVGSLDEDFRFSEEGSKVCVFLYDIEIGRFNCEKMGVFWKEEVRPEIELLLKKAAEKFDSSGFDFHMVKDLRFSRDYVKTCEGCYFFKENKCGFPLRLSSGFACCDWAGGKRFHWEKITSQAENV